MLEALSRLSVQDLSAVDALEQVVVTADGGRLKLEKQYLRAGERVHAFLWRHDGEVVGFCGVYRFSAPAEITGMVHPDHRGQGLGARLLQEAFARSGGSPLLVVPRHSIGGRALAKRYGGTLDHSEHALILEGRRPTLAGAPMSTSGAPRSTTPARSGASSPAASGKPIRTWIACWLTATM